MKAIIIAALVAVIAVLSVTAIAEANVSYGDARRASDKAGKQIAFRYDAQYNFGGCVRRNNINMTCRLDFYDWRDTSNYCRIFLRVWKYNAHDSRYYWKYKTGSCR